MTCILFDSGSVAVDSNHVLPDTGESYISPSKIVKFPSPLPFMLDKREGWTTHGKDVAFPVASDIDDRIHGYTLTGSTTHAEKFIDDWQAARRYRRDCWLLEQSADNNALISDVLDTMTPEQRRDIEQTALLDSLIRHHYAVHVLGYSAEDTGFTLIFIGEKACYRYRSHKEGAGAFDVVGPNKVHAYGSGCESVHENYKLYRSHVMAIYATMLVDAGSAGFVEVWKLPTIAHPELYREGLWNPRSKEEIRELLKKNEEPVPDMISPKSARLLANQYFEAGAFLGQCPNALKRQRKMAAKDPSLAEHAIRMFGGNDSPKYIAMREVFLKDWKKKGWLLMPSVEAKSEKLKAESPKAKRADRPCAKIKSPRKKAP